MSKILGLRTLISNGWTRKTRLLFEQKLGKENFDVLKNVYSDVQKMQNFPFCPNASVQGKDIFLSFKFSFANISNFFDISKIPTCVRGRFKQGIDKVFDTFLPKFKNEEINIKNIGSSFSNLDFNTFVNEEKLMKAIGLNIKREKYSISELVKVKNVGDSANLKCSPDFSTEIITDNEMFLNKIAKLFGKSKEEVSDILLGSNENIQNFVIKQKGKPVGFFSIDEVDDALHIGNYVLYPQYRNSKTSLNAILSVRDSVFNQAMQKGIKKIEAQVEVNNPKLLGLYKRFGFKANGKETYTYIDDLGQSYSGDNYNLIKYID